MLVYAVEYSTSETNRRLVDAELFVEANSPEKAREKAATILVADPRNDCVRIGRALLDIPL